MKKITLLICLLISINSISQISVGPTHYGKSKEFKDGELEKFKSTTTLFVLPNSIEKNKYEEILKDSWTITPYEIVDLDNFKIENYLTGEYSIAKLETILRLSRSGYFSFYNFIDFQIFDEKEILESFNKYSGKKWEKKKRSVINDNSSDIARFYIYPKDDLLETIIKDDLDEVPGSMYNNDNFFNYSLGYLKNYIQMVNNLLINGETYWLYGDDFDPNINVLKDKKLYLPSYMSVKYRGLAWKDGDPDEENVEEIFNEYEFDYEIIENEELNRKILNQEDIYYLRYVRVNTERFLQIVNAKSGDVIYRNYIHGNSYNLKSKDIDKLSKTISDTSSD